MGCFGLDVGTDGAFKVADLVTKQETIKNMLGGTKTASAKLWISHYFRPVIKNNFFGYPGFCENGIH